MKQFIASLFIFLLCCCYANYDLNDYSQQKPRYEVYYWYYNDTLFNYIDSCQVIGFLYNQNNDRFQINRRCPIFHDTLYIDKKSIIGTCRYFDGILIINNKDYSIKTVLQ